MSAKRAFSAAGILLLVGTLVLQPGMADGQGGQKAAPVEVVNTTANPVPTVAQGVTTVGGSLQVVNTTANPVPTVAQGVTTVGGSVVIAGTPTVALAASGNTVQIGNASSAPVPTSGQEDATRQSFAREVLVNLPNGTVTGFVGFTCVSVGTRLIIEDVSGLGTVPTGQKIAARLEIFAAGILLYRHFLTLSPQLSAGGIDFQTTTQHMHLYLDGGQCITVFAGRDSAVGDARYAATISGYLISPVP